MFKKQITRIINEEINNFDYLDNDKQTKEDELYNLLNNEDFQKQFICDFLLRKDNVIKKVDESRIGGNYEDDEPTYISLEYFVDYTYTYDSKKEPIAFSISFNGDKIGISVHSQTDKGDYYTPSHTEEYYTGVMWNDVEVEMYGHDGSDIDFIAFKKAPQKIRELFIRDNIENFISDQTYDTGKLKRDNIRSIPYC